MAAGTGGNGANWYQTWVPIMAAGVVVLASVSGYFSSQGANSNTVANLQATVQAQGDRITRLQTSLQNQQLAIAENCRQLATVEVQMGTVETVMNKAEVSDRRDIALLWNKIYGQEYPEVFYAVSIPHEAMPCVSPR